MDGEMKPQVGGGPSPEASRRMAMQMDAAMGHAQAELSRPSAGEEAAERAGRASRAAVLAFSDLGHPESPEFVLPLVMAIAQQAYGAEWQRLVCTDREAWHE